MNPMKILFYIVKIIKIPIFSVCDKSNAESTSSNIQNGAGLYLSKANTKDNAISDLYPFC